MRISPAAFERSRLSFGTAADLYDAVRPSYPPEAARWMVGDAPVRLADIGAGTGICSRVLAGLGHDVVAVEPDSGMRRTLAETSPGIAVLEGSAEKIPLPDASVDAVTAAQAWHWFERDAAHAEVVRVLRPGGVVAAIWNREDGQRIIDHVLSTVNVERDAVDVSDLTAGGLSGSGADRGQLLESVEWVAELWSAAGPPGRLRGRGREELAKTFGPRFSDPERAAFPHGVERDVDVLVGYNSSRSHYLVASPDEQHRLVEATREIADRLPPRFEMPYVAVAMRARKL